jgi:hypothetical protein
MNPHDGARRRLDSRRRVRNVIEMRKRSAVRLRRAAADFDRDSGEKYITGEGNVHGGARCRRTESKGSARALLRRQPGCTASRSRGKRAVVGLLVERAAGGVKRRRAIGECAMACQPAAPRPWRPRYALRVDRVIRRLRVRARKVHCRASFVLLRAWVRSSDGLGRHWPSKPVRGNWGAGSVPAGEASGERLAALF